MCQKWFIRTVCLRAPVYDFSEMLDSGTLTLVIRDILENSVDQVHGFEDDATRNRMLSELKMDANLFNPIKAVSRIAPRPLLITTGDSDRLVHLDGVRKFFNRAQEPKHLSIIAGANHNLSDSGIFRITVQEIIDWFKSTLT